MSVSVLVSLNFIFFCFRVHLALSFIEYKRNMSTVEAASAPAMKQQAGPPHPTEFMEQDAPLPRTPETPYQLENPPPQSQADAAQIQDELRRQRQYMNDVLDSLPKGITQLSMEDAMWLIEALRTLGVSKLQANTLAARLCRGLGNNSMQWERGLSQVNINSQEAFFSAFPGRKHQNAGSLLGFMTTGKPFHPSDFSFGTAFVKHEYSASWHGFDVADM